jgi:negative regulator of replication initiation
MPTIRIDDDIWEHLKKNSTFVDTPSDVLRRIIPNLPKPTPSNAAAPPRNGTKYLLRADRDYANVPITSYEFDGGRLELVHTFKGVLLGICGRLRSSYGDKFDNVALTLHGKKRSYFSRSSSGMIHPRPIPGGGATKKDLYVESNMSATAIMGLCQHLVRSFGHDVSKFRVH